MSRIFVRASRRARAHTRSSIARKNKLTQLIGKVGNKMSGLDVRFGPQRRRFAQLKALHNSLRAKSFETSLVLAGKRQTGYKRLHKQTHGGYNIF